MFENPRLKPRATYDGKNATLWFHTGTELLHQEISKRDIVRMMKQLSETLQSMEFNAAGAPEIYRYVCHQKMKEFEDNGWVLASDLSGSTHGQWSVLMKLPHS